MITQNDCISYRVLFRSIDTADNGSDPSLISFSRWERARLHTVYRTIEIIFNASRWSWRMTSWMTTKSLYSFVKYSPLVYRLAMMSQVVQQRRFARNRIKYLCLQESISLYMNQQEWVGNAVLTIPTQSDNNQCNGDSHRIHECWYW